MTETLASLGLAGADLDRALAAYRERYDEVGWKENSVFTGMDSLLDRLATDGYRMAVATSKDQDAARRILAHFDLTAPFEFIGGADLSVGRLAKADVVAHSLEALGRRAVPADEGGTPQVMMIGDRQHDVHGAARFGIDTALVRWGYGRPEEWDDARWSVVDTNQLEGIIRDW